MRSPIAIALFIIVIVSTLLITRWAARRTHSRSEFYAAGSSITGTQNGLAIAGDFMSASTILGVAGLVFTGNSDAVLYIVAPLVGFTIMLLFIAEPLRNLGRYTVPEVVALRFPGRAVRAFTAAAALVVTIFYLIAQMVGAGALIEDPARRAVLARRGRRRDSHDDVRRVRRHARDDLGADHEGSRADHRRAADDGADVRARRLRHRLAVLRSRARRWTLVFTGNTTGALNSLYSTLSLGLALSLGVVRTAARADAILHRARCAAGAPLDRRRDGAHRVGIPDRAVRAQLRRDCVRVRQAGVLRRQRASCAAARTWRSCICRGCWAATC